VAITSTFYDTSAGTPASLVDEVKWAKSHPHIGSSIYGVADIPDFKVTAHPTTPMTVNVAAGAAWGHGVFDVSDAVVTVTCDPPGSGTRWDLICLRRDWTPAVGGPTSVTSVEGGSTRTIPAARENVPGTLDDHPLALVEWTYGSTLPTTIVDLRVWGGDGGLFACDPLVLTFLTRMGTLVNVAGTNWQRIVGAGELAEWKRVSEVEKIQLFGTSNYIHGVTSPGQTGFMMQAGTVVNHTDGAGFARVTFPRPFPNGLLTIVFVNGDSSIDRAIDRVLTYAVAGVPWHNGLKTDVVYSVAFSNPVDGSYDPAVSQLHRINYIAIGW
jgi:hypothetical protein